MRQWELAFEPGNHHLAEQVAAFMRNQWSWTVDVHEDGYIKYIYRNSSREYYWDEDYEDDLPEQIDILRSTLNLSDGHFAKLDAKFNKVSSIGKYTILPLPKGPVKQPLASASSPSVKEGVSLPFSS